ncbi:MAG: RDD family protein [Bacteroidota bacterium]
MPKFVTNQNIEIELELGSLGERILAFLIDAVIMLVLIIVVSSIVSKLALEDWMIFLLFVPLMLYSLVFEYFGNGQTLGKRAMDIKVVRLDGSTPAIGSYLLRWLFRLVDLWLYPLAFVPAVVSIVVTKNGQRIGDLVAGTTVIKIRKVEAEQAFQLTSEADYQVSFPSVKVLNDQKIELIKKALKMRKQGYNDQGVSVLAHKLKELMSVESELPDVSFLHTVVKDYEHIARESY